MKRVIAIGEAATGSWKLIQVGLGGTRERPALAEAAFDRMPCDDAILAELPAEEDDVVVFDFPGKIDEALIDILEEAAERFDLVGEFGHTGGGFAQLRMAFDDLGELEVFDGGINLEDRGDSGAQFAGAHLEVAHKEVERRDKLVGLVGIEEFVEAVIWQMSLAGSGACAHACLGYRRKPPCLTSDRILR